MKTRNSFRISAVLALLFFNCLNTGKSCNNSSYTLTSMVITPGPTYTLTTSLCVGYGRTGFAFGADGPTGTVFSLAIFGAATLSIPANPAGPLVSWLPITLTGPPQVPTTPTYASFQAGPGFGIGEKDNIIFYDPAFATNYTCILTTAACGLIGSWCKTITLVYKGTKPDSIRAVGIEGVVPFGGCYPNSDMVFGTAILPVVWGDFTGINLQGGVDLEWNTMQEHNNKEFKVMRSTAFSDDFIEIGRVSANGNSDDSKNYSFFDTNPFPGENVYQLVEVDQDGSTNKSESIHLSFSSPNGLSLGAVFPNPTSGVSNVQVFSKEEVLANIEVISIAGLKIFSGQKSLLSGNNQFSIDLANAAPGIYILRIITNHGILEKKLVRN